MPWHTLNILTSTLSASHLTARHALYAVKLEVLWKASPRKLFSIFPLKEFNLNTSIKCNYIPPSCNNDLPANKRSTQKP